MNLEAFTVRFNRAESFQGKKKAPFVLRAINESDDDFARLRNDLMIAMKREGLYVRRSSFAPHVTMFYGDALPRREPIDEVSWVVNEFVLVHSAQGETKYSILGSWRLRGAKSVRAA